ncbi:sensor histidine kinase [Diplocloster hominis]|uniref:sensor histidine kinase n=1 Tax=Diplocloster hominis TaxID=3079010 RepID=UPI0031BA0FCC
MEAVLSEYITCVIEATMTMAFCLIVTRDILLKRLPVLALTAAGLAVFGSAASMGLSAGLDAWLSFSMDFSIFSLPLWLGAGFFLLRWATGEPPSGLLLILLLSEQTLYLCRSITHFIYGLFFPELTEGVFCWADIAGFGVPSVVLTLLLAVFCRGLYHKLRRLNMKEYGRLWLIPLFFILLYLAQVNLYPVDQGYSLSYGLKILLNVCAFITYSQTAWAISSSTKAAKEAETRTQLANQLDLQRARVQDLESHAEEIKRIRHDRRQHVQVLRGLLEKGAVKEALAYLEDYEGSMAKSFQPPLCENFVADTLCLRYEALAKQAGVEVSISASLPKEPGVAGSDLAVILGNLWENAVAAALDAGEGKRFIRLRIQAQEEQVLIRMENGYGGVIYQEEDGQFLSGKPGRNRAVGVGIASVRAMAEKYGGMADFTYTPDTFTASVLLYTIR